MVTHAQPLERVMHPVDGLDLLASATIGLGCVDRELLQSLSDPLPEVGGSLLIARTATGDSSIA